MRQGHVLIESSLSTTSKRAKIASKSVTDSVDRKIGRDDSVNIGQVKSEIYFTLKSVTT